MIGKVTRGDHVGSLLYYLYGPGKATEHVNPHLVAGWEHPAELEPPWRPNGSRDFRRLIGLLNEPLAALGADGYAKAVWHCIVRAAPQDEVMSDDAWAEIAHEVMHHTGLAPLGADDAVRWVAVRHADDHIHIAATLARQDGTKPRTWNDFYRVREACRAVEDRLGLRVTAAGDRTAARRPTRAESEQVQRRRWKEAPRIALRRHVVTAAAGASNEQEFFAALEADGVRVRRRFSEHTPGEVTGYAIGLDHHTSRTGEPVWYGGGKLAADLTLPKLRRRWNTPQPPARDNTTQTQRRKGGFGSGQRLLMRAAVRAAAARTGSERDFFAALEAVGLLVRLRFSQTNPGEVTGYAVSLPGHLDYRGEQIWIGGGRLCDDLTLPQIRRRLHAGTAPGPHPRRETTWLTAEDRDAIWDHISVTVTVVTDQIRIWSRTDPAAACDAAWAASDALHVCASTSGHPQLRQAADAYDRASRRPHGRIPRPSLLGSRLRAAARLLALAGSVDHRLLTSIKLIVNLAALASAIADLRHAQQHAAQAAAARAAAERLMSAVPDLQGAAVKPTQAPRNGAATDLARQDFPGVFRPSQRKPKATGADRRHLPRSRQRPTPPEPGSPRR
ncbi:MAG: relaxase/mobilization nuclease domain-containing protein [Streptomycetales bacterium]